MGQFDFTVYDNNTGMPTYVKYETIGKIYLVLWLIISNIMLLNLLVAMFNNTYAKLVQKGNGLFLIEIINIRPQMLYDEYYSGLVNSPFPFNAFNIFLIIPYFFVKSRRYN